MRFRRKISRKLTYDDLVEQLSKLMLIFDVGESRLIKTDLYTFFLSVKYGGGYEEIMDDGQNYSQTVRLVVTQRDLTMDPWLRYSCDECGAGTGTLVGTITHLHEHMQARLANNTVQTATLHILP